MKILELRHKSEQVLGDQFDIKEFHNEILKRGALPLSTLELFIDEWLASKI
jgi:uncharacterized protein (DUF885 family)